MPTFPVSPGKQNELKRRMRSLKIFEKDLVEAFVRGSGSGGQKINKTSVAVQLNHLTSGISVRCQEGRSQGLNRYYARKRLVEKIENRILKEASQEQKKIEKIRRQKRKRSKRAKEKMLAGKKKLSVKKQARKKPLADEE